MADSTQVNVRYSNVLLARIDAASGSGGVSRSQFIVEACRQYLDGPKNAVVAQVDRAPESLTPKGGMATREVAGSSPAAAPIRYTHIASATMNDKMAALLAKHPVISTDTSYEATLDILAEETEPIHSCSVCDKGMVAKHIKGRGMVYACSDLSCPAYGIERK